MQPSFRIILNYLMIENKNIAHDFKERNALNWVWLAPTTFMRPEVKIHLLLLLFFGLFLYVTKYLQSHSRKIGFYTHFKVD